MEGDKLQVYPVTCMHASTHKCTHAQCCVYLFIWVYAPVYVRTHTDVCPCLWKAEVDFGYLVSIHSPPFFQRTLISSIQLYLLTNESHIYAPPAAVLDKHAKHAITYMLSFSLSFYLHLRSPGFIGMRHHTRFYVVVGMEPRASFWLL